ncbi:MAG: N-6 DNA methylase [Alphaproteobacteria bacterium]|nr:N-6 DNA methylase [Alphaproteobacteria bacterium]
MAAPAILDLYLNEIRSVRALGAGTPETSYYPAVKLALDAIGATLKPRVICLHHPKGSAGIPDFGLFEAPRTRNAPPPVWQSDSTPERGVVEVKGTRHSIAALIESPQIRTQYLPHYQLVLATNLWQFRLLRQDGGTIETLDLAADEPAFWSLVHGTRPKTLQTRFADFLERCLQSAAPITRPSDLARFLASYARDALAHLAERADLPALKNLRDGLQSALGVAFDARDGEHLFRSTLVQTLFYGVFSAWVAHTRDNPAGRFDWRSAQWSLTVPVARYLFGQIATPDALGPLQLVPLLDAAGDTLNRVDRSAFFKNFTDTDAVQYFYEPFLEYFDPDLRKQLGVWYTPPEIVTYMVERVDRVLRSELNLPDGLADPNVWVLDPCCGTGSYLNAVLRRISKTLDDKGIGDLAAEQLKKAAMTRIVGFEIMTAPLVIAHWQVGETLRRAGAPLHQGERAAIFLTNALTGWDSAEQKNQLTGFDVLLAERTAANAVKQEKPILVVLGNPPYNAYAGTSQAGENDADGQSLVAPYKAGLREKWGIKKYNLDDLFVRFFRIAERRIAERTGRGVVCYISNFAWLFLPSFVTMRERFLCEFDHIRIDNLNGDSRETGKIAPDGTPDPSVFSTPFNREGIRVGTAIGTLIRAADHDDGPAEVRYREFWGTEKRTALLRSLDTATENPAYSAIKPSAANKFSFRNGAEAIDYESWPSLADLSRFLPTLGLNENRGGALADIQRGKLELRLQRYLDRHTPFAQLSTIIPELTVSWAGFDPRRVRDKLVTSALAHEHFEPSSIKPFMFRPFDIRWAYITEAPSLWNRSRPELQHLLPVAEGFLTTRVHGIADPEGFPTCFTRALCDQHAQHKDIYLIPIIENLSGAPRPNLSDSAAAYLTTIGLPADATAAAMIWHHALAITYSPAYLAENVGGIRQGWPRVPLPTTAAALQSSAALGAHLAALLDPDTSVDGVTSGTIRPELRAIAVPSTAQGAERDWRLTAWGTRTDKGITMPGRGHVEPRPYTPAEAATAAHAATLGATTTDVFLNRSTFWRNIPDSVWDCRIGGYQVLKKWLSYRDASIIDRPLSPDEVAHIQNTARRLTAILLLGPALDTSYRACAASHRLDA